ncbi:MAG: peptidyl-prolyl cis-trans isomerase [Bacteroidales bacterium]|nr:MAG: peptidyl-prolyl cis-trans isomerase [Bacteroidales bacterium]
MTPGEVERYFKSLKEDELPLIPKQYMYAQIVRYPASQDVAKQRARERLLEMRERIITGKSSLPVLARLYSADPGSAMRGARLTYGPPVAVAAVVCGGCGRAQAGPGCRRSSRRSSASISSS